ncbi:MAG: hypothetical protein JRJ51_04490 [Deltaproteobacteria bacterium]|nr:hypothetical protein [Deltaproteobacteria bacterium]
MTELTYHWRETASCQESIVPKDKNDKCQNPNIKWFDKLTTLSQVEGQIPMTKIQNSKLLNVPKANPLQVLVIGIWILRFI